MLAFNPIVLFITLATRVALLGRAPISKDLGFAALLAGIEKNDLDIVKGAAFSGKVRTGIRLGFVTEKDDDRYFTSGVGHSRVRRHGTIRMKLERFSRQYEDGSRHNHGIDRKVIYRWFSYLVDIGVV